MAGEFWAGVGANMRAAIMELPLTPPHAEDILALHIRESIGGNTAVSPALWAQLGGMETKKALALWAAREAAAAALADSTAQSQIVAIQRSAGGDADAVRIAELMQEAQSGLSAEERAVFDSVKHQRCWIDHCGLTGGCVLAKECPSSALHGAAVAEAAVVGVSRVRRILRGRILDLCKAGEARRLVTEHQVL